MTVKRHAQWPETKAANRIQPSLILFCTSYCDVSSVKKKLIVLLSFTVFDINVKKKIIILQNDIALFNN